MKPGSRPFPLRGGNPRLVLALLVSAIAMPAATPRQPSLRMAHPSIVLKDEDGRNVLTSAKAISTRKTCGECHDYGFITDSFHFQQGKNEMDPALLKGHGFASFHTSPGMFGKFSILPNRQLTPSGVANPVDVDLTQPEWLTKCGVCHTGGGVAEFDLKGRPLLSPEAKPEGPLDPSYTVRDRLTGAVLPWDWHKSGVAEADCFMCHTPKASRGDRREAMAAGDFRWANNGTLAKSGIVTKDAKGHFSYNRQAFNPDGTVKSEVLDLSDPPLETCAQCHGFSARRADAIQPIQHADILRGAEKAGWVYNGSKISETLSPNIVGREKMDYPWDIHAAKGLGCIDCHFSPNNPGRKLQSDAAKHLSYKPVGEDLAEYLKRPDHNFARGNIPPETVNVSRHNTMRGCSECHDAEQAHAFLSSTPVLNDDVVEFFAEEFVDYAFVGSADFKEVCQRTDRRAAIAERSGLEQLADGIRGVAVIADERLEIVTAACERGLLATQLIGAGTLCALFGAARLQLLAQIGNLALKPLEGIDGGLEAQVGLTAFDSQ